MKKVIFSLICLVKQNKQKEKITMNNLSHFSRNFNHLSLAEKKLIQKFLSKGFKPSKIASILDRSRSTISRHINNKANTDFVKLGKKVKRMYVASIAHHNYINNKSRRGAKYKLFNDLNLVKYLEDKVINEKWSPEVAIGRAKLLGLSFKISITPKSVYNYIQRNQIKITPFDLRFKLRRKKSKHLNIKVHKKKLGLSIEQRPLSVENRTEFGHWEADCVVDKNNNSVLVLQERMTRFCTIVKLNHHDSNSCFKQLEIFKRKFGKSSKLIFKTITCDNGSEFYSFPLTKNTNVYYAHPYCSYEKGGVENLNGIIRRYINKGQDISKLSRQKIQSIKEHINSIPRKILDYKTPQEIFEENISSIVA